MTKTPGESSGSSSFPAYARPAAALLVAAVGFVVAALMVAVYPGALSLFGMRGWAASVVDTIVISAPLVIAVIVAVRVAGSAVAGGAGKFGASTGIRPLVLLDLVFGLLVGLVARALVEVVAPTTGSLTGPLGDGTITAAIVVTLITVVLVSPVVEELFFRGVALRALRDMLGPGALSAVIAIALTTVAFVALHLLPSLLAGVTGVSTALILGTVAVGIGCGTLTWITGRLGAALAAHVVFNGVGAALLLW
jgi:membrane protease YdiL (CAAX protease family)